MDFILGCIMVAVIVTVGFFFLNIMDFILGCIMVAVIVTVGFFFLNIIFGLIIAAGALIVGLIGWIGDKLRGK